MASQTLQVKKEDHALERVPDEERQNWLTLSWSTAGIATTLVQLFFGALITFVAGFKIALIAGVFVTCIGALMGWLTGHVAYKTGLSSTVLARYFGFGNQGSVIASIIFSFMIIGFLAIENALLYKGFIFYFGLQDTLTSKIAIYGILTACWVFLTTYGFKLVSKVSSTTLVAFLLVLGYMTWQVVVQSPVDPKTLTSFPSQFPAEVLMSMGADTDLGKFIFAVNILIGSAGALALVDADIGRYAKSSSQIGIAALMGNICMDIIMVAIGGMIMYAGVPALVDFYVGQGVAPDVAHKMALESPDSIAAAFIVFGGIIGSILMVLAQAKGQVLNTYSASLSLSNLFDATFKWRPGRVTFVIIANILGLVMLYGEILALVNAWITLLGVLTTCVSTVIICDYFFIADQRRAMQNAQAVNWAGVITTIVSTVLAHYVLKDLFPVEFFTALVSSVVLYPALRKSIFRVGPRAVSETGF